jgi:uncharacterized membrane protein
MKGFVVPPPPGPPPGPGKRLLLRLRSWFLTGLIVITPIGLTILILRAIFVRLDAILGDLFPRILGRQIPGLGLLALLVVILAAGLLAQSLIGWQLIRLGQRAVARIPLVSKLYLGLQQILEVFLGGESRVFREVVLVEYPRRGLWSLGFLTAESPGEADERIGQRIVNVFFPTTPNPATGWFVLVPESEVVRLTMSVEDGVKMIVSAGAYVPAWKPSSTEMGP